MQQNAPFCVLLKKHFSGGAKPPRSPPTAFSLSRVGMYGSVFITAEGMHLQEFEHVTFCTSKQNNNNGCKNTFSKQNIFRRQVPPTLT